MNILLTFFFLFFLLQDTTASPDAFKKPMVTKKIVILGAGYVGCVTGASLAKMGHEIIFVDPDFTKIILLNQGKSPIFEPGLEELLENGIYSGLIHAQETIGDALLNADMAFIAVQTPTNHDGKPETQYLERALKTLGNCVQERTRPLIISIRSTAPPMSIRTIYDHCIGEANQNISLVVNPEFLRESTAIDDFYHPPLLCRRRR